MSTTRLRLDIAYDGTNFAGWARQPGQRTVQGEIESALATIFRRHGEPPTLTVAGRTDVGVHALGQVAHLDLTGAQLAALNRPHRSSPSAMSVPRGPDALPRRINGIAGPTADLVIASARVAPDGFDARFSASWRRYEYRIADAGARRDPLRRVSTLWYPTRLDESAMRSAAGSLLGLHDWAAYCKPREGATTVRDLLEFTWHRDEDGVLIATLKADAFCHSMVRALVGACVAAGEGRMGVERAVGVRDERTRGSEFVVQPAKGLTLLEVGYPPDAELAARAEQTRARREAVDRALTASGPID